MSGITERPVGPAVSTHSATRPEHITLTGHIVALVPLNPSHANDLFEVYGGEQKAWIWDYLPDGPFLDLPDFHNIIERKSNSADPLFFAIVDKSTSKPVGSLALTRINTTNRTVELGHVAYSTLLQQKPGATEAMYLIARYVFDDLGFRRYEWKSESLNDASKRAAPRLGFTFEALLRQQLVRKGRSRDVAWFSMLDSEWPECRRAFELWLAPDNFDEEGRQKFSLASFRKSGHQS